MKKLICFYLILALTVQAVGCYSSRDIKLTDLENNRSDKLYLTTNDLSEYILLNETKDLNISNWSVVDDSLFLSTNRLKAYSKNGDLVVNEQEAIPSSSIKNLHMYEFNALATTELVVGILEVFVGLLFIGVGNFSFANSHNQ